jgi:hypothetical protein
MACAAMARQQRDGKQTTGMLVSSIVHDKQRALGAGAKTCVARPSTLLHAWPLMLMVLSSKRAEC